MIVLEFDAKSFLERIALRATKNFPRHANWVGCEFLPQFIEETNFQKYLVLFQDEFDSEIEDNPLNILEVLVLQYLPESNCGLVRFLRLEFGEKKEEYGLKCDWGQRLIEEAEIVLNKEAEKNGFQRVHEIFYHVSADFNSTTGSYFSCLYNIGFRLVQTEHFWRKSTQNNCRHLLVYRPFLIPDFQVENGSLPGHIKIDIIQKFLKDLLTLTGHLKNGFDVSDVEELQVLIGNLEESTSEVFVKSSFPWRGRAEPCAENQVAVVGGGMAGLAAAASLSEAGFDVVLLEAANYLGGRVKQVQPFKGFAPIDLGGEFIHGSDSIINRIAKENGWPVEPCHSCEEAKSEVIFYYNGKMHSLFSNHPDIQKAWRTWDELIFLWEKKDKDDFLQNSENSDEAKGKDKVLSKDGGKANVIEENSISVCDFADSGAKLEKSQEAERREDMTCDDFRPSLSQDRDMSILEWLKRRECNEDVIAVFECMYCQTVAATPDHMGVLESAREENAWKYGAGNYRLVGSYSQLVKYLLDKCTKVDKRLSWQVKEINWKGSISQTTDDRSADSGGNIVLKSQRGEIVTAKYVVITVPLTILKDGDINFIPPLPANKKIAIDAIQMRGALKIVCRFKSQFWPDNVNLIYSVRGFVSQIWMYTRDSVESDEKCHVIAGFQTAEPAEEKISLSGKDVLDRFLRQLDEIFSTNSNPHPASNSLVDYVYYHWSNHPFIRGGYSSPTVHAQGMRHVLASPVDDCLFFAGEATSLTACATIHTAIETGFRAASEVCRRVKRVYTNLNQT